MISILNNIVQRAKKLLLLLIIIPLVTGVVSYYLESKKPTTYIAKTKVEVGNFDNEWIADPMYIEEAFKTGKYLKDIKELTNADINITDVNSRFVVTTPSPADKKILTFQYSGTDKKEVEKTLYDLTVGFEGIRNVEYQRKLKNQQDSIALIETLEPDSKLVEVKNEINQVTYRPTRVLTDKVEATPTYSNPLKRALFGIILGLMLNVVILVTPELFREYR